MDQPGSLSEGSSRACRK